MKRYSKKILDILQDSDIICGFDSYQKSIYAYRKEQYGEIFCFYGMIGTGISSLTIYSLPIPNCRQEDIIKYLLEVDLLFAGSCFYIDPITRCIVLSAVYNAEYSNEQINSEQFANFCKGGYEIFQKHQNNIYTLTRDIYKNKEQADKA